MNRPVNHIICAVRGQPESRKTVTKAIDLALEHKAQLTFCLVIDVEFLGQATPTLTPLSAAYRQLEELGEFSMLILCDRAQRRGVRKVEYLILRGDVTTQLHQLVSEVKGEILVMGRPMSGRVFNVFTPEEFDSFVDKLEKETGIQVVEVIHDERINDIEDSKDN